MRKASVLLCLSIFAFSHGIAIAADSVSRRDGFLILWESIHRPLQPTSEKPFADMKDGERGFAEITYAKARGILDDDSPTFNPDAPLQARDALLMLYRTRNVDDLDAMTADTLPALIKQYPAPPLVTRVNRELQVMDGAVTEDELRQAMQALDTKLAQEQHEVSLYSEKFQGKGTAFGEKFDMNELTAAHRTFPANTLVRVTNVENGKYVVVRINDRGPYVDGRDMDLSLAAFTTIADRSKGKIMATFERLGDVSMVAGDASSSAGNGSSSSGGSSSSSEASSSSSESPDPVFQSSCPAFGYQQRITRNVRLIRGLPQVMPLGDSVLLRSTSAFVVRSIKYPDGFLVSVQDWILPHERYLLKPSIPGTYIFKISSKDGHTREMKTTVVECHS